MKTFDKQVEKLRNRLKYRGFTTDYELELLFKKYFKEVYEQGVADGYAARVNETNKSMS